MKDNSNRYDNLIATASVLFITFVLGALIYAFINIFC